MELARTSSRDLPDVCRNWAILKKKCRNKTKRKRRNPERNLMRNKTNLMLILQQHRPTDKQKGPIENEHELGARVENDEQEHDRVVEKNDEHQIRKMNPFLLLLEGLDRQLAAVLTIQGRGDLPVELGVKAQTREMKATKVQDGGDLLLEVAEMKGKRLHPQMVGMREKNPCQQEAHQCNDGRDRDLRTAKSNVPPSQKLLWMLFRHLRLLWKRLRPHSPLPYIPLDP
jgi:hypothetical protein